MTIGARGGVALVLNIKSVKKVVLRVKTFTRKQTLFKYSGLVLLSDLLEYAQTLFIVQLDFFLFLMGPDLYFSKRGQPRSMFSV